MPPCLTLDASMPDLGVPPLNSCKFLKHPSTALIFHSLGLPATKGFLQSNFGNTAPESNGPVVRIHKAASRPVFHERMVGTKGQGDGRDSRDPKQAVYNYPGQSIRAMLVRSFLPNFIQFP